LIAIDEVRRFGRGGCALWFGLFIDCCAR
jgi:hypothetical protein